jgi:plastocyanin
MRAHSLCFVLASLLVVIGACSSTTASVAKDPDSGVAPDAAEVDAGTDAPDGVKTHTVKVTNFLYTPEKLTISVGDTVEWIWEEGTHTVSSGAGCVADKKIESGEETAPFTFRHTFTEAGTVPYFCDFMSHCAKGQTGIITVTAK